mgnify:CR=1 FL=1
MRSCLKPSVHPPTTPGVHSPPSTAAGTSDYILYAFQLIDARTSAIVWEDNAEIKKQGLEDAAYR